MKTNYRKQKKELTKLLKIALWLQEEHPISNSANQQVKNLLRLIAELKKSKKCT
jgi:hypothetical protein